MLNCLLFFVLFMQWKQTQINIAPYVEYFYYSTYQEKFKSWRATFLKMFLPLNFLGWTSGFHAIDDWPRAHWDETEFNLMLLYTIQKF